MKRTLIAAAAMALVLAACGDTEAELEPDDAALPPAAAACLPDVPVCEDTGIVNDEPPLLPGEPTGEEPGDAAEPLVGNPLSVDEAVTAGIEGPFAITGFYVASGSGPRLCEALAESFPPQCGGTGIPLIGTDQIDPDELQTNQGVTWSDFPMTVVGEIVDGTFVATPIAE